MIAVALNRWSAPYWMKARADEVTRHTLDRFLCEGAISHYYEYWSLFSAKAYALKEPRGKLEKYLDVPAVRRGDLYYILNLVAVMEAKSPTRQSRYGDGAP